LSPTDRQRATALPQTLQETAKLIGIGTNIEYALRQGATKLADAGFSVDYLELAHTTTLAPVRDLAAPARLLAAAHIGSTRLIDNIAV
jgi:pantoate--beta-alanine ligase